MWVSSSRCSTRLVAFSLESERCFQLVMASMMIVPKLNTDSVMIHMRQIAEKLTFAVLSVTKFENSMCSWDFLEVSQEAKVAPFLSSWPSTATTMSFGHRGYLKNAKKMAFFWDHFEFSLKNSENRRYCFPNFSMKTLPTEKTKYTTT